MKKLLKLPLRMAVLPFIAIKRYCHIEKELRRIAPALFHVFTDAYNPR